MVFDLSLGLNKLNKKLKFFFSQNEKTKNKSTQGGNRKKQTKIKKYDTRNACVHCTYNDIQKLSIKPGVYNDKINKFFLSDANQKQSFILRNAKRFG